MTNRLLVVMYTVHHLAVMVTAIFDAVFNIPLIDPLLSPTRLRVHKDPVVVGGGVRHFKKQPATNCRMPALCLS